MDQTPTTTEAAPAAAPAPAPAAEPAAGSLLASGATATPPVEPAPEEHFLPAKFRVVKDDKSIDIEASAKKLAEAYTHAEKRIGSGDLPPKAPEDYSLTGLPETVDMAALKADPEMAGFLKAAHAKGMTDSQVSFALNEYLSRLAAAQPQAPDPAQVAAELRAEWKSEKDYSTNLRNAFRAFDAYAAPGDKERMDEIGNNPVVIRLLARIGADLAEDAPIAAGTPEATSWQSQVDAIRADPIYNDPKHPQHKAMKDKMQALYDRRYGTQPVKLGGGKTFGTQR